MQMHNDEKYEDEFNENINNNKLYLTTINKDEVDAAGNCFLIVNYKVGRALTSMFYLHE